MAYGVDGMSAGKVIRKRIYLAVGMFTVAASITVAYFAMRDVMDVGGFCASGGPYDIRQECPDTTWLMMLAFPAGFVGIGFLVAAHIPTGPSFLMLAWSGLFIALGMNFLVYGLDPPDPATGIAWGWLICAAIFLPMGGIPLAGMILNARETFWDDRSKRPDDAAQITDVLKLLAAVQDPRGDTHGATSGAVVIDVDGVVASAAPTRTTAPTSPSGGDDITDSLERLAGLHERGQLSDEEFAAAKARLLEED